ncbi:MAG: extracellular solute-binding protein [Actinomycetes bacterium]
MENMLVNVGARRRKRRRVLAAIAVGASLLAACSSTASVAPSPSSSSTPGPLTGTGTINVLTWETYHNDPWVAQAEKDLGIKINITRAGSVDEMYAKARSNSSQYDMYLVDSGSISRYVAANLIAPVDPSLLTNIGNVSPALDWQSLNTINGKIWAIPYNWGVQPMVFDKNKVPAADQTSWKTLWDPKYKGKVMVPDDAYITLPIVALAAGIDPFKWSAADYTTMQAKLSELRGQIRTLTKSFSEQEAMMASGDALVGYAQAYDYVAKHANLGMSFPTEGVPFWQDNYFFSPRGATNLDAYRFVDYTLTKAWQCRFANETLQNGILDPSVAKSCLTPDAWAGAGGNLVSQLTPQLRHKFVLLQAPPDMDKRLALWNAFKAGA